MDTEQRRGFWNLPLHEYKRRLEDIVKGTKILKVKESNVSLINGIANMILSDKQNNKYSVRIEREMPRYTVSVKYKDADSTNANLLENCVFRAFQGEACVDIIINDKHYGAIPFQQHNL